MSAGTIYVTSFGSDALYSMPVGGASFTLVASGIPTDNSGNPDSLVVLGSKLYYTVFNGFPSGELRVYDVLAASDTLIASGFSVSLSDIVLDPSLTTVVVSDQGNNALVRVTLSGGAKATLATITFPTGLAYAGGNLFVLSYNSGTNKSTLYKLNPTTGATIATSAAILNFGDGLCYDSSTGQLWAGWGDGTLRSFDTATCALVTTTSLPNPAAQLDGVASIGDGNIYACDFVRSFLCIYNIGSATWASQIFVPNGIDDITIGSPPSINCNNPQPATIGEPYAANPLASGGTPPYTYAITGGSLPPGLSLNSSTGAITGTPRNSGTYQFTLTVTDSTGATAVVTCSIPVNPPGGGSQLPYKNPGLNSDFILKKLTVSLKKDPRLPVRGAL